MRTAGLPNGASPHSLQYVIPSLPIIFAPLITWNLLRIITKLSVSLSCRDRVQCALKSTVRHYTVRKRHRQLHRQRQRPSRVQTCAYIGVGHNTSFVPCHCSPSLISLQFRRRFISKFTSLQASPLFHRIQATMNSRSDDAPPQRKLSPEAFARKNEKKRLNRLKLKEKKRDEKEAGGAGGADPRTEVKPRANEGKGASRSVVLGQTSSETMKSILGIKTAGKSCKVDL